MGLRAVHKPTISSHFWRFFLVFLSFWNVLSPNILMGSSQQKEGRKEGREGGKGFPKHRGPQSSLGEACGMERSGTEAAAPGLWTSVEQVDSIGIISDEDAYPHVSSWVSNCGCGLVAQLCPTLCDPLDCSPAGSAVLGGSPGKNPGVGCHARLQGIFPIQGSKRGLPYYMQVLYRLSHPGKPTRREGSVSLHELQSLRLQGLGSIPSVPNSAGEAKVRGRRETFALILNAWEDMGVGEGKPGGFPSPVTVLWLCSGIISISVEAPPETLMRGRGGGGRGKTGWSLSGCWRVSKNNGSFPQHILFAATRGQRERSYQVPPCLLATPSPRLG